MSAPQVAALGAQLAPGSRTNSGVPVPAGVVSGSVVVVALYLESTTPVTPPPEFTEFATRIMTSRVTGQRLYWKRATAADSGTYTFTHSAAYTSAVAVRISGAVATGTPVELLALGARALAGTTTPPVEGTTAGVDRLLFHVGTSFLAGTWTQPVGWTERLDGKELGVFTAEQGPQGPTGSITATSTQSSAQTAALFAVVPAATEKAPDPVGAVLSVVAGAEPGRVPPRIRIDVTDNRTTPATEVTVIRINPDGRTSPVRTFDGAPLQLAVSGSGRVGLLYDYEAPYNTAVSYSFEQDPTVRSAEVTLVEDRPWLIHPGVPALSRPIDLRAASFGEELYSVQQGVFYPMGRENPVVVTDGARRGAQSSMTVKTSTVDELRAIRALIRDAGTLLLNIPPSLGLMVDSCYIAVGDVSMARTSNIGYDPWRHFVMPYHVVDRPAGGSQAERTLLDLLDFPTLDALRVAYPTLDDVLAGP